MGEYVRPVRARNRYAAAVNIVLHKDAEITRWVRERSPDPLVREHGFGLCSAIGVSDGVKLVAGVVYHEYRGHSIQLSMASTSPRWCTRRTLRALLGYPFKQLHVSRITACTAKSNTALRSLVARLNFKLEGTIRCGLDGKQDLLIYGLLREEAEQWITDHEKRTVSTACS